MRDKKELEKLIFKPRFGPVLPYRREAIHAAISLLMDLCYENKKLGAIMRNVTYRDDQYTSDEMTMFFQGEQSYMPIGYYHYGSGMKRAEAAEALVEETRQTIQNKMYAQRSQYHIYEIGIRRSVGGGYMYIEDSSRPASDSFAVMHSYCMAEEGILFSTARSRENVKANIALIDKAIGAHLDMIERFIPLTKEYLKNFTKPIIGKEALDAFKPTATKYQDATMALDNGRGSDKELKSWTKAYIKYYRGKRFNRADYKKEDVSEAELNLIRKLCEGGEYDKKYFKLLAEMKALRSEIVALQDKFRSKQKDDYTVPYIDVATGEFNWFLDQLNYTAGDRDYVVKTSKREKEALSSIPKKTPASESFLVSCHCGATR